MDEYIKREDAIRAIIEHPSKIGVFTAKAIKAIENLPTADVVPKSEVEELKVRLELKQKAHESLKELYRIDIDALVEARRKTEVEVAREIFEEIEKIMERYLDSPLCNYHKIRIALAELKKKYKEEEK